jgi:hypothetical protein
MDVRRLSRRSNFPPSQAGRRRDRHGKDGSGTWKWTWCEDNRHVINEPTFLDISLTDIKWLFHLHSFGEAELLKDLSKIGHKAVRQVSRDCDRKLQSNLQV